MNQCDICGAMVERRKMGPHVSAHRRTERAKYVYPKGGKRPHEWITCVTCEQPALVKVGGRYCSTRCSKMGELNPQWKGDAAPSNTARRRAHTRYPNDVCSRCGSTDHVHRHHRNRNTYDNSPDNIEILCAKCHAKEHARPRPVCPVCGSLCKDLRRTYCSPKCWGVVRSRRAAA